MKPIASSIAASQLAAGKTGQDGVDANAADAMQTLCSIARVEDQAVDFDGHGVHHGKSTVSVCQGKDAFV